MSRQRGTSKFEESNVDSFVESCVSLESNVSYDCVGNYKEETALKTLLILGTKNEFEKVPASPHFKEVPFFAAITNSEYFKFAMTEAKEGKVFWYSDLTLKAGTAYRVAIGLVPEEASRYNCPARPDVIISLIADVSSKGENFDVISVSSCAQSRIAIGSAVAKGVSRSFSAKSQKWNEKYMNDRPTVHFYYWGSTLEIVPYMESMKSISTCIQLCMRLIDAPTNLLDTTTFPEIAAALGKKWGYQVKTISGEALREEGFGGIYGVGKAAEFPPALVVCSYAPEGGKKPDMKTIGLVGKGVVYDTGGLSLKTPTPFMSGMKCDMGGSAAVFAGFLCGVMQRTPSVLHCALCLADNAVGPRAQRNDDIVVLKSGRTVEINNTDAEGRLVLSDGVNYLSRSEFNADVVIDMATLTGAQGIATGKYHAGLFTNNGDWEDKFMTEGKRTGDLLMPLLYCPEFHTPEFASKVADGRNSVKNRSNAQSSCAGQFICNNLEKGFKGAYVHVDLAAPSFHDEAATGYGVALLCGIFNAVGPAQK